MSGKTGLRIRGWYALAALVVFTAIGLTASGALAGRLTDVYNPAHPGVDTAASNAVEGVKAAQPMTGSASLVISQQYGGGGNSGATWRSDYVEIFNPTSSAVSVSGWSVQYASAAGSFTVSNTTMLSGSVQPYSYYLVKEADGANITTTLPLPTPDAIGTIAMSATAAKVALVSSTSVITSCTSTSVVDLIGYGATATCFEGTAPAPGLSNTTADLRANGGCIDNDQNSTDFTAGTPNPRNSASPPNNCLGTATPT